MARPKRSAEVIEAQRRQALRLHEEGYSVGEIGRITESAASSVMRWHNALAQDGERG